MKAFSGGMYVAALLIAGLSGCVGGTVAVPEVGGRIANPVAEVENLAADIEKGRINQLDVFSPTLFAEASRSFSQARLALQQGAPLADVAQGVVKSRAQLRQAEENALIVRSMMPETIKAREQARKAGAETLKADYQKVEGDFLELTHAVETSNLNKAQKRKAEVTRAFDELELAAIKDRYLKDSRDLIATAEKEGAAKQAPASYQEARRQLEAAETFIAGNRYQNDEIEGKAAGAEFYANRLLQITRQSKAYRGRAPEDIALEMERMLFRISDEMGAGDLRNRSFESQSENLAAVAGQTRERNIYLEKTLQEQSSTLETLSRQEKSIREQWQTEKRFNDAFAEIQKLFHPAEAEVSKQGANLVIRLKTIQFPIGKSFLLPENFELLGRVQKSIGLFDNPIVTIEGHTDSTGTVQANEKLSMDRAAAVEEYLIANRTVAPDHISSRGYGSSRPLAANETSQGRAINRRIDVIIKPASAPTSPRG
ncbi:MAG: OmpA family protein [Desulfuromonadaceae bacterium]|nr:OmpA family protein [Desulfuromonadaceae bacterium]